MTDDSRSPLVYMDLVSERQLLVEALQRRESVSAR